MSDEKNPSSESHEPTEGFGFPGSAAAKPAQPTPAVDGQSSAKPVEAIRPAPAPSPAKRAPTLVWILLVFASGIAGAAVGWFLRRPPPIETRFLNLDERDKSLLDNGWGDAEIGKTGDSLRWCAARSCKLRLESRADAERAIVVRVSPFRFPNAPPQTMQAFLNEVALGKHILADDMTVVSYDAPKGLWRAGTNELVLEFAYAEPPKNHAPDNADARTLSAYFDWIQIAAR
jgi:hypothetical protein